MKTICASKNVVLTYAFVSLIQNIFLLQLIMLTLKHVINCQTCVILEYTNDMISLLTRSETMLLVRQMVFSYNFLCLANISLIRLQICLLQKMHVPIPIVPTNFKGWWQENTLHSTRMYSILTPLLEYLVVVWSFEKS